MYTDVSEAELERYFGEVDNPADFDDFWSATLDQARLAAASHSVERTLVSTPLTLIDTYDVTFPGFAGEPIKGWLRLPRNTTRPLPTIVEYIGYGGGRGHVLSDVTYPLAGFAHFVMDTRGQGAADWSQGETGDPYGDGPQSQGVMTKGIRSRETYFYRRLFTDAALAVDAVRTFDQVDSSRVAVTGVSQGGGVCLAAAYLATDVRAVAPRVPFLCDYRHAVKVTNSNPFAEIATYLSGHRDEDENVYSTLSYFDGVNFARRTQIPANFAVGLMDTIVPPSTVYAAYNNYRGPKELLVRRHNGHEAGGPYDWEEALAFFHEILL